MTLRELRTLKGWTQKDLAARAGVSLEVIAKMERGKGSGKTYVSLEAAKRVSENLGITLDGLWDLLTAEEPPLKQGNNALKWTKAKKVAK